MAWSFLCDGCQGEDELEELEITVGMREDPREQALADLRAHQEAVGLVFENPDEPVLPPLGSQDEEFR